MGFAAVRSPGGSNVNTLRLGRGQNINKNLACVNWHAGEFTDKLATPRVVSKEIIPHVGLFSDSFAGMEAMSALLTLFEAASHLDAGESGAVGLYHAGFTVTLFYGATAAEVACDVVICGVPDVVLWIPCHQYTSLFLACITPCYFVCRCCSVIS